MSVSKYGQIMSDYAAAYFYFIRDDGQKRMAPFQQIVNIGMGVEMESMTRSMDDVFRKYPLPESVRAIMLSAKNMYGHVRIPDYKKMYREYRRLHLEEVGTNALIAEYSQIEALQVKQTEYLADIVRSIMNESFQESESQAHKAEGCGYNYFGYKCGLCSRECGECRNKFSCEEAKNAQVISLLRMLHF